MGYFCLAPLGKLNELAYVTLGTAKNKVKGAGCFLPLAWLCEIGKRHRNEAFSQEGGKGVDTKGSKRL